MSKIEKRDIHHRKRGFETALNSLKHRYTGIERNKELILVFIRDCRLGKTIKGKQKKVIGVARCTKYIHILKKISSWFNKPFDEVAQADMEKLIEDLENDKYKAELKGRDGKTIRVKKYAHSTKLDYKRTIKKFYKWLLGNNDHYPELVEWIETYDIVREIRALRRKEVEKLADALGIRNKAIVMFLFDSGARVEEALNVRLGDLTKAADSYKVRIAHSKTKPRTIHLPICPKYLEMWLNECGQKDEKSFLFPLTYEALRRMLHRAGKKVLNKHVTPHMLRHSSATYYANLIKNPYKLCYRYGWVMSSDMVNRYLDREGILEEETPEIVKTHDISKLEKDNQFLKEELAIVREFNRELKADVEEVKKEMGEIYEGKNFMKLLTALTENQRKISKTIEQMTGKKFDVILSSQKAVTRF